MTVTGNQPLYQSYAAFWPFYLSQHKRRGARLLHIVGMLLGLFSLLMALICLSFTWLFMAPIFGYGLAWIAHFFYEKNRPATFTYPLWSLRADFGMLALWLSGRFEEELLRHKIMT